MTLAPKHNRRRAWSPEPKTRIVTWIVTGLFLTFGFACFQALMNPERGARSTTASTPGSQPSSAASPELALLSAVGTESGSGSYHVVEGQVQNISNQPIRSVVAVATWYDKNGQFITSDDALIDYNPILPGQTSPFKTMSRTNPAMEKFTIAFKRMAGTAIDVEDRRAGKAAPRSDGGPPEMFQVRTGNRDRFYHGASCDRVLGEQKFLSLAEAAKSLKPCPVCKPPLVRDGLAVNSAMNTTTLRDVWNGHSIELGIAWTLRKRNHEAQCVLFSHEFGWELRLEVGELFRTHVCRSTDEILDSQEA